MRARLTAILLPTNLSLAVSAIPVPEGPRILAGGKPATRVRPPETAKKLFPPRRGGGTISRPPQFKGSIYKSSPCHSATSRAPNFFIGESPGARPRIAYKSLRLTTIVGGRFGAAGQLPELCDLRVDPCHNRPALLGGPRGSRSFGVGSRREAMTRPSRPPPAGTIHPRPGRMLASLLHSF